MAKKVKDSEMADEYKKIRYAGVVQKFFSITFELDRQRLVISSAGIGFIMAKIPLDKDTFACFMCVNFLIDILWVIALLAFSYTIGLMLIMFKKERKFFATVMKKYEETNENKVEELTNEAKKIDGKLDLFDDSANFSFAISIFCAILFIVLEAVT